jgi:hypothetical protein
MDLPIGESTKTPRLPVPARPRGDEIAAKMANRIAGGLPPDHWCRAWLKVNDEVNKKYGAAAGVDNQGYWLLGSSPRIVGPLPIPKS